MQNSQIAEKIKFLCKNKGISLTTLIEDCSLTKSIIYDMEKRDKTPSVEKIERIAEYLNVSLDYLVGRTNEDELVLKNQMEHLKKLLSQSAEGNLMVDEAGITDYGWNKLKEFVIKNSTEIEQGINQLKEKKDL